MSTKNRLAFGLLVFSFLMANIFVTLAFRESSYSTAAQCVTAACTGGLVAEVCLLAIWSVLAVEPIAKRLPKTLTLLVLGWLAWFGRLRLMDNNVSIEAALISAGGGAGLFVLTLISLLVVRRLLGQRIQHVSSQAGAGHSRVQFSIGQLLAWTTSVAVILAVGKFVLPHNFSGFGSMGRELLPVVGMGLLYACAVDMLVLPCVMVALDDKIQIAWLIALLVDFVLVPPFAILVLSAFAGSPPSELGRVVGFFYAAAGGVVCTTTGSLFVVRTCGFRMRRTKIPAARSREVASTGSQAND